MDEKLIDTERRVEWRNAAVGRYGPATTRPSAIKNQLRAPAVVGFLAFNESG
jgi:hypothetical protein